MKAATDNQKDLDFSADILWDGRTGGQITVRDLAPLRMDALPEFGGEGRQPCPDELFLAGIGGCLLTTFLYVSRKLILPLVDLKISVVGKVNLVGAEGYRVTCLGAEIHVKTVKGRESSANECVQLTGRFCHLTRLVEAELPLELSSKIESVDEKIQDFPNAP